MKLNKLLIVAVAVTALCPKAAAITKSEVIDMISQQIDHLENAAASWGPDNPYTNYAIEGARGLTSLANAINKGTYDREFQGDIVPVDFDNHIENLIGSTDWVIERINTKALTWIVGPQGLKEADLEQDFSEVLKTFQMNRQVLSEILNRARREGLGEPRTRWSSAVGNYAKPWES